MIDPLEAVAIVLAGLVAGTMNTIVGSGSLITFPTLLAVGYSPLVANVSNTIGLVPGSLSGVVGYRREMAGQRERAIPLLIAGGLGGLAGGLLLLVLPAEAFARIVPILILVACGLVIVQPRVSAWVAERRRVAGTDGGGGGPALLVGVFLTGIYGGYFGAAQGVILIALLSILSPTTCSGSTASRTPSRSSSTRSRRCCSSSWRRSPGRPRCSWRSARPSVARSARPSGGACRPRGVRGTIVVVGVTVAIRLLFG